MTQLLISPSQHAPSLHMTETKEMHKKLHLCEEFFIHAKLLVFFFLFGKINKSFFQGHGIFIVFYPLNSTTSTVNERDELKLFDVDGNFMFCGGFRAGK